MGEVAPVGGGLYAREYAGLALRTADDGEIRADGSARQRGPRLDLARDRGQADDDLVQRPMGFRGCLRSAARLHARIPIRHRARGISGPHYDGDARRADLHVSADRGALFPGEADSNLSASASETAAGGGNVRDHRSGPVEI